MYVSFGVTSKITPSPTDFLPPAPLSVDERRSGRALRC